MTELDAIAQRCIKELKSGSLHWETKPRDLPACREILDAAPEQQVELALQLVASAQTSLSWENHRMGYAVLRELLSALLRRKLPFTASNLAFLGRAAASTGTGYYYTSYIPIAPLLSRIEEAIAASALTDELRAAVAVMQKSIEPYGSMAENRKLWTRMAVLLHGGDEVHPLIPQDAWALAALEESRTWSGTQRDAWTALFTFLRQSSSKPSKKWLKDARAKVGAVGADAFAEALERWLPLFDVPKKDAGSKIDGTYLSLFNDQNLDTLRGLIFCALVLERPSIATPIGSLAERSYKKVSGVGPLAPKIGNAAVYVLGELGTPEALGQLGRLRTRVKSPSGSKAIEKTFVAAAERAGLTPEDLEELYVPAAGATDKETTALLAAQRDRLDSLYLQRRTWPFADWRARYLDHPLVGTLARRLIWRFDDIDAFWSDDALRDVHGNAVGVEATTVSLWHPIDSPPADVLAWRKRLEALQITQPFKQAHREIYVLTDAEIATSTYSNRFAAHILRQHQFAALCRDRRWRYSLQGAFDSQNTPTITLPAWNLGAEYWVEGIHNEGQWTEAGIYLHVATDQVRFTDNTGAAVPLLDVPPLVFSEVMRHVDLFVGVASIGNDPAWSDRGDNRFSGYWSTYAFGDLSASASTRRVVLESLVPRLKIANRCSFEDRYLVVRGDLNTYKIHLGSSNILIEPGSRYLCIVPARQKEQKLYVPFEGDSLLSVIVSKALLLADDRKITDPTIVRQLTN